MNISAIKIELAKKLLDTTDENLIKHLKAIFTMQSENWFEELPEPVKKSVKRGLQQAKNGETIPHEVVMKKYKKWLDK